MTWPRFIKTALGVLLVVVPLAIVWQTGVVLFSTSESARVRSQAVAADILVPTLAAVLGTFALTIAVNAAVTLADYVRRSAAGEKNLSKINILDW